MNLLFFIFICADLLRIALATDGDINNRGAISNTNGCVIFTDSTGPGFNAVVLFLAADAAFACCKSSNLSITDFSNQVKFIISLN